MQFYDHFLFWSNNSDSFAEATKDMSNVWGFDQFCQTEDPQKGHCIFISCKNNYNENDPDSYFLRYSVDPQSIFTEIIRKNPSLAIHARTSLGEENHSVFRFRSVYLSDSDSAALTGTDKVEPNYHWEPETLFSTLPESVINKLKSNLETFFKKFDKFWVDGDSDYNVFVSAEFSQDTVTIETRIDNYKVKATKKGHIITIVDLEKE